MNKLYLLFAVLTVLPFSLAVAVDDVIANETPKELNSGSAYSRLAEENDLKGFWRVVKWTPYMEIKGADWRMPLFLRHQWMAFDGKGHLKTIAANKKITAEYAKKRLTKAPWSIKITFNRKGFCEISTETKKYPDSMWRCAVITRDLKLKSRKMDLKKGDVIMTLLDDDENILYFRLMRKAPTSSPLP